MAIVDVEVGIVNLTEEERRHGISGKRLERTVGVVASRLVVAKVVGTGDIAVANGRKLMMPIFKASGNSMPALDPSDVVEELPSVGNVPFRNVIRFSVMRVRNRRAVEIKSGSTAIATD